jgi:hypothetical protein
VGTREECAQVAAYDEWIRGSINSLQDGPLFIDFFKRTVSSSLVSDKSESPRCARLSHCVVDQRSDWIFVFGR